MPVALGGLGNNRGAVVGGFALGLFQQAANFLVGGIFSSVAVFVSVHRRPACRAARLVRRARHPEGVMEAASGLAETAAPERPGPTRGRVGQLAPLLLVFAAAALVPFVGNDYWVLIATRAAIYWLLVAALNLMVGFAGQLAIGYVALLALGAYTTSILAAGNVLPPLPAFVALIAAGVVGAAFGVVVGLPALRLRTFYFAIRRSASPPSSRRSRSPGKRDRRRHRPARARAAGALRQRRGASSASASPYPRSAPG